MRRRPALASARGPHPVGGGTPQASAQILTRAARLDLLDGIEGAIEEVRHELVVHMKRMGQVQEQVDELRLAIRQWAASARSRKTSARPSRSPGRTRGR